MTRNRILSALEIEGRRTRVLGLPFMTESSRDLATHWLDAARDQLVARRSDLDPSMMKATLPSVVIHEMQDDGDFVIRLAGTSLRDIYGYDLTGRSYLDFVAPDRREQAGLRLRRFVSHPCGLFTVLVAPVKDEVVRSFESLGLPLVGWGGELNGAIYTSVEIEPEALRLGPDSQVCYLVAESPTYFDIGAGVPVGCVPA
jgi:hypothetical protein